jgi:cytochrome c
MLAAWLLAGCGPASPDGGDAIRTGSPASSAPPAPASVEQRALADGPAGNAAPAPVPAPQTQPQPPDTAGVEAGAAEPAAPKTPAEYLAEPRFATADVKRGQLLSLACAVCHTFDAGGKTLVGPNLHHVFGRKAASLPDFDYSPQLRASGIVWTPAMLERWLADPAGFVAGTKMGFTGYRSADDRRDLIAYLLHATEE